MSPRAACRLERLGLERVYDYVAGIADWKAAGLPVEGTAPGYQQVADATERVKELERDQKAIAGSQGQKGLEQLRKAAAQLDGLAREQRELGKKTENLAQGEQGKQGKQGEEGREGK